MANRLLGVALTFCVLLEISNARAQSVAPPGVHDPTAFDLMNVLAKQGLHDLSNEPWNAYGQFTYISVFKPSFHAPYTNANGSVNSLAADYERSFAATFSLFLGARLWRGGEAYLAPEAISERPLSRLRGRGGTIEIYELQKNGSETLTPYRARLFLRQSFDLGGADLPVDSNPLQLGRTAKTRRVVLTAGNFSVIDVYDKNGVTGDPRQTFFNLAFMTHSSYDFPAEARGFTVGLVGELYWDDWALRMGRFAPPKHPNEHSLDYRFWERYGDSLELEHDHTIAGLPGAVRILGYRNHVFSGRFDDAVAAYDADSLKNAGNCPSTSYNYGSGNFTAPDLCWVRKPNVKLGIGVNLEQLVATGVGVFLRAMYSDGRTEVDAYNSADADISLGSVVKGTLWHRPFDVTGLGFAISFISDAHARYLAMGGVDAFIGDGHLRRAPEGLVEAFYSVNLLKAIWMAASYQLLWNPGYNADRAGPVHLPGVKVHAEF
jgi:hypothetical protein